MALLYSTAQGQPLWLLVRNLYLQSEAVDHTLACRPEREHLLIPFRATHSPENQPSTPSRNTLRTLKHEYLRKEPHPLVQRLHTGLDYRTASSGTCGNTSAPCDHHR